MQSIQHGKIARSAPAGLTLIELIVVLFVALILFAVIGTWLDDRGRPTGRRVECMSHLHNIGIAVYGYTSANNGQLPSIVDANGFNWPTAMLAQLDQQQLITAGPNYWGNAQNGSSIGIRVLTCPSDANNFYKSYGLSYAVNAGASDWYGSETAWNEPWGPNCWMHWNDLDWNEDGTLDAADVELARDTGVFHRSYDDQGRPLDGFRMTLDRVGQRDGLSQTLMIGENANAMNWGYSVGPSDSATSTENGVIQTGFVLSATINGANPACDASFINGKLESTASSPPGLGFSWINSNQGRAQGRSPALSSFHAGVVNVLFCDGSAKGLNERIDHAVYVRLMTSGGVKHGEAQVNALDY